MFSKQIEIVKQEKARLRSQIAKADEELHLLQMYRDEYKYVFESMRGSFDKPQVDISAKIKLYANHDTDRLDKLLFTASNSRDVIVGFTINKLQ